MTVAERLVDRLVRRGIDTVFGIPGTQTLPLNTAIESRDDIRFVMGRHETAISHEAWGYNQTSGEMAATLVVPGPGDVNAMNGLKNALNDCSPVLHISVETDPAVRGGDPIHEMEPDTYDNVVKENVTVGTPSSAIAECERAIAIARTPPAGPVRLGVPGTFLSDEGGIADGGAEDPEPAAAIPEDATREAIDLLEGSDSPLVVAGGGVRAAGASSELAALAETVDAPVATTYKGKGVFPEDHPLSLGTLGRATSHEMLSCVESSDVVCCVGTDLDAQIFRNWSVDLSNVIHVTVTPGDVGRGYEPAVGIVADAKRVLRELTDSIDPSSRDGRDRVEAVRTVEDERLERIATVGSGPSTAGALDRIREVLPRDAIVSVDVSGLRTWSNVAFDAYGPRRFVTPGSWGTMATGLPAAVGAKVANPDRDVVALTGDGGLLMCIHELHTAVAEELPITVVVFNNNDYAMISKIAEKRSPDGGGFAWAEAPITFQPLADAMGLETALAETGDEVDEAVAAALESDAPTVIEIPVDPDEPEPRDVVRGELPER